MDKAHFMLYIQVDQETGEWFWVGPLDGENDPIYYPPDSDDPVPAKEWILKYYRESK